MPIHKQLRRRASLNARQFGTKTKKGSSDGMERNDDDDEHDCSSQATFHTAEQESATTSRSASPLFLTAQPSLPAQRVSVPSVKTTSAEAANNFRHVGEMRSLNRREDDHRRPITETAAGCDATTAAPRRDMVQHAGVSSAGRGDHPPSPSQITSLVSDGSERDEERSRDIRFPVGTQIKKYFRRQGWLSGHLIYSDVGDYVVEFQDGRLQAFREAEMDEIAKFAKIGVGTRIAVYWPEDKCYYNATVHREQNCPKSFFIEYDDDGVSEWINLRQHKFKLADDPFDDHSAIYRFSSSESKVQGNSKDCLSGGECANIVGKDKGLTVDCENLFDTEIATANHTKQSDFSLKRSPSGVITPTPIYSVRNTSTGSSCDTDLNGFFDCATPAEISEWKVEAHQIGRERKRLDEKEEDASFADTSTGDDDSDESGCALRRVSSSRSRRRPNHNKRTLERKRGASVVSGDEILESNFGKKKAKKRKEPEDEDSASCVVADTDDDEKDNQNNAQYQSPDISRVKIGARIAVYWPDDEAFYKGTVTNARDRRKPFRIEYDDGDSEWIDLREHAFRLLPGRPRKLGLDQSNTPKKRQATHHVSAVARKASGDRRNGESAKSTKQNSPTTEVITPKMLAEIARIRVGSRVAVWWPDDRRFYHGVITRKQEEAQWKPFFLEYDDGDEEWIDFRQHKFKILSQHKDVNVSDESDHNDEGASISDTAIYHVNIGSRLAVWWPGEKEYFHCTVTRMRDHARPFYLEYDDGDREWIDLTQTKFYLLLKDRRGRGR